ncbi:MAG: hypothetical protein HYS13_07970 [Planctomycetia bacterium]|nr:hypothetical protein [Planctomycetia bacterium]
MTPRPDGRFAHSRSAAFLVCALALPGSAAWAQTPQGDSAAVTIQELRVGFEGKFKVGVWTPATVVLRGGSEAARGKLSAALPDGDESRSRFFAPGEVAVPAGGRVEAPLFLKFGKRDAPVEVRFEPAGAAGDAATRPLSVQFPCLAEGTAPHVPVPLQEGQELYLAVGGQFDLEPGANLNRPAGQPRAETAAVESPQALPTRWFGYEGVDAVVLFTSRVEAFRGGGPWMDALDEWIQLGGRLIVVAGKNGPELLQAGGPLARFSPGAVQPELAVMRRPNDLEAYAERAESLEIDPAGVPACFVSDVPGMIVVHDGNVPIVVRFARGFGEVVFVAVDLDQPPFSQWRGNAALLLRLLGRNPEAPAQSAEPAAGGKLTHSGLTDLSGQMRSALDQFSGVTVVPFFGIGLLLVVYAALVGPLDYLVLSRYIRRPGLTWITFPSVVAAACLGVWLLVRYTKGDELRVNRVDLVDIDLATRTARGTTWIGVFSPEVASYDVAVRPVVPGRTAGGTHTLLSWQGMPGEALGGLDRSSTPGYSPAGEYSFSPELDSLRGVPIAIWSSKGLQARWTGAVDPGIDVSFAVEHSGSPRATVASRLPFALHECLLTFPHQSDDPTASPPLWVVEIPTLAPGQTVAIDSRTPRRELRERLTGQRLEYDARRNQYHAFINEYDDLGLEPRPILQAMMFHEAGGGQRFTKLDHRYQGYLDLSRKLALSRGILLGYADAPATRIELNGREAPAREGDRQLTCYRFLFPVKQLMTGE